MNILSIVRYLYVMAIIPLEFFATHTKAFLSLHLLGLALGLGGATITDLLFFNFLRDFIISKKEAEVMGILSNVIMGAILLLYISGAALYLSDMPRFNASPAFLSKVIIVVVLSINGILMHKHVAPHMVYLSFLLHPIRSQHELQRLRKFAFAMGAISFTSWYSVFFIATLKSYFPDWVTHIHILSTYAAIVLVAVGVSQVMRLRLRKMFSLR